MHAMLRRNEVQLPVRRIAPVPPEQPDRPDPARVRQKRLILCKTDVVRPGILKKRIRDHRVLRKRIKLPRRVRVHPEQSPLTQLSQLPPQHAVPRLAAFVERQAAVVVRHHCKNHRRTSLLSMSRRFRRKACSFCPGRGNSRMMPCSGFRSRAAAPDGRASIRPGRPRRRPQKRTQIPRNANSKVMFRPFGRRNSSCVRAPHVSSPAIPICAREQRIHV